MPEGPPLGAPEGAPEGAPDGMPDGAPLGIPEAGRQFPCPVSPESVEDDESPEPQATNARGESTSRATAGTRRARFMRNSSKNDE
ncbi:hypothetical protein STRCI_005653 [Streptomyces cinnabarinus]|uniref:Uncharacterized protein n=1 Tax=Streptomyces cinnabarinus TaxID=67287 RepID=A0ABY7KIS8_9ACTN|nr:hypothetical protein [Streptomyces cinnabarinus]WAZ24249.1 hypothetical protein STRCI_005653 [Streptomyces cinnabarinus]